MKDFGEIIECACGCGKTLLKYDKRGRGRRFILGHSGKKHNMYKTPTYNSWSDMLQRCNNPKNIAYKNYGARGITVCDRWLKFENFFKDMGVRPEVLTIERVDNNLGYFKENCCYDTRTNQSRNQRLNKRNKTGVAGVTWHKGLKKWRVNIERKHIGVFLNLDDAIKARKQSELEHWGTR